jgi:hypothetical protein
MTYYLLREERSFGPYTEIELHTMLAEGQVQHIDQVCIAGTNEWRPLESFPQFGHRPLSRSSDSAGSAIIPYKNPHALTAYYLGVFSLIPCFGLLLAIPAVILGSLGLKKARENPGSKGTFHAWAGIILGGFMIILQAGLAAYFLLRAR